MRVLFLEVVWATWKYRALYWWHKSPALHYPALFGNKQVISQSWQKTSIHTAREIMFPCREEGSLQSWSYRLHGLWSLHKAEKIRLSSICHTTGQDIHDTSWIDWGNKSLCLKFRQFNLDSGFHSEWNFPGATKNRFCIRLQFDGGFNSCNGRQHFYIRWRHVVDVINSGHVSADQSELFLGLDTCNNNAMNFPMGYHTSDNQDIAICVHHTLQSLSG